MFIIKKGSAAVLPFKAVLASDHLTPAVGLSNTFIAALWQGDTFIAGLPSSDFAELGGGPVIGENATGIYYLHLSAINTALMEPGPAFIHVAHGTPIDYVNLNIQIEVESNAANISNIWQIPLGENTTVIGRFTDITTGAPVDGIVTADIDVYTRYNSIVGGAVSDGNTPLAVTAPTNPHNGMAFIGPIASPFVSTLITYYLKSTAKNAECTIAVQFYTPASVDLTPVTDMLTEMEGAGFNTLNDSLKASNLTQVQALTTIEAELSLAMGQPDFDSDTDTLHEIRAALDAINGTGLNLWSYTLTSSSTGDPINGAELFVSSDSAGDTVIGPRKFTNDQGKCWWLLPAGTCYVWRRKDGYSDGEWTSDTEVVP